MKLKERELKTKNMKTKRKCRLLTTSLHSEDYEKGVYLFRSRYQLVTYN